MRTFVIPEIAELVEKGNCFERVGAYTLLATVDNGHGKAVVSLGYLDSEELNNPTYKCLFYSILKKQTDKGGERAWETRLYGEPVTKGTSTLADWYKTATANANQAFTEHLQETYWISEDLVKV